MRKSWASFPVIFLIALACSKSPGSPESSPGPPKIPDRSIIEMTAPDNAPKDVNSFYRDTRSGLEYVFTFLEPAKEVIAHGEYPDYTWRKDVGAYDVIVNASVVDEDQVGWEVRLDGSSWENWLNYRGTTESSEALGSWEIYRFGTSEILMESDWSRQADGVLEINNYVPIQLRRFELVGNPDGSANLVVTASDITIFKAEWDAAGHGFWNSYDYPSGHQLESGSW